VSVALQRKLMDRKLRNPLETCLMAEDGVTSQTLLDALLAAAGRHLAAGRRCCARSAPRASCRKCITCRCIRWRSCC
jgi:hypothetical protein